MSTVATAARVLTMVDVQAYIDGVLDNSIIVGDLVRLAVDRHVDDLKHAAERDLVFSAELAEKRLAFCPLSTHIKGEWAGDEFEPAPFQAFCMAMIHGWRRLDGRRRFTTAYIQVAKKNGKTFWGSNEGLFGTGIDGESGAEVYSIATKEDQAKLSWSPAKRTVEISGELQEEFDTTMKSIYCESSASKWIPLGSDSKTSDGMNPSLLLVDELHAHPNGDLYNNMKMSMASRRQPLTFIMTTAGAGKTSFCYALRGSCVDILNRVTEDDSTFAFIAELDKNDDWRDPSVWSKANPNLGVSVKLDFLLEECQKAQDNPRIENDFRRYHCDEWTEQVTRWIAMHKWDACVDVLPSDYRAQVEWYHRKREELKGQRCFGGMDLSRRVDMTSFSLVFPPTDMGDPKGIWTVLPYFWIPEGKIVDQVDQDGVVREKTGGDNVPYRVWAESGLIDIIPGETIKLPTVEEYIKSEADYFRILKIGYDPHSATDIATRMYDDGLPVIEVRQTVVNMNEPSKLLEVLIADERIDHGANPVLRWNVANAAVHENTTGLIMPTKDKSSGKIDGLIASLMGIARAIRDDGTDGDDGEIYTMGGEAA